MFEPDNDLIGPEQWTFIDDALKALDKEDDTRTRPSREAGQEEGQEAGEEEGEEEGGAPPATPVGSVDCIVVACDVPFTGRTPAEVHQLERSRPPTW
jgi:hypothetical protein